MLTLAGFCGRFADGSRNGRLKTSAPNRIERIKVEIQKEKKNCGGRTKGTREILDYYIIYEAGQEALRDRDKVIIRYWYPKKTST